MHLIHFNFILHLIHFNFILHFQENSKRNTLIINLLMVGILPQPLYKIMTREMLIFIKSSLWSLISIK